MRENEKKNKFLFLLYTYFVQCTNSKNSATGMFALNRVDGFCAVLRKQQWSFTDVLNKCNDQLLEAIFLICECKKTVKWEF